MTTRNTRILGLGVLGAAAALTSVVAAPGADAAMTIGLAPNAVATSGCATTIVASGGTPGQTLTVTDNGTPLGGVSAGIISLTGGLTLTWLPEGAGVHNLVATSNGVSVTTPITVAANTGAGSTGCGPASMLKTGLAFIGFGSVAPFLGL
ncbi:hypothetical protein [Nocardia stercoris]|uniref:Ig-like domain repeat protein n=1 Tax=Nocardia stercoris TaxID=2483361 RepID=A0A3M2L211_9NOCA|nr:hypothetical protein [Nocardia stercoris]RMI29855.1 hypothetical protein EBN03_23960 [Nocardia stercoris]